jgi:hypothetical protein
MGKKTWQNPGLFLGVLRRDTASKYFHMEYKAGSTVFRSDQISNCK